MTLFAQQIENDLEWLKTDFQIEMPEGSPLRYIYSLICKEREKCLSRDVFASGEMKTEELCAFSGLHRILSKLKKARCEGKISSALHGHIKLLDKCIPSRTSQYRDFSLASSYSREIIDNSNVLFELVVALAALDIGTDVVLEPLKGKNKTDVCVTVDGEMGFCL